MTYWTPHNGSWYSVPVLDASPGMQASGVGCHHVKGAKSLVNQWSLSSAVIWFSAPAWEPLDRLGRFPMKVITTDRAKWIRLTTQEKEAE